MNGPTALATRLAVALALAAACGPAARGPAAPGDDAPPLEAELAELAIPPPADIDGVLARLEARAEAGEIDAAWARAHYLLDLFDDARFRGSDASLRALERALGVPPADADAPAERGAAATDRALAGIAQELDRITSQARLHRGARDARTLVRFDAERPGSHREVYQAMGELKAIARADGPLAANARLRLFAYGRRAFEDAVRAPWADRPRVIAHALYPLYGADPRAYFAENPAERPPPPDPDVLAGELSELLRAAASESRMSAAAEAEVETLERLWADHADDVPREPNADALALPSAAQVPFYDWTPALVLGAGDHDSSEELAAGVESAIRGDGRGRLAVALAAHAPATALLEAGEAAALSGAHTLEVLVLTQQYYAPPRNDYWSERARGRDIERVGVIPLDLAALGGTSRRRDDPREPEPNSHDAGLELHLVIDRDAWRLVSPEGQLESIASDTSAHDPAGELRAQLDRVREAYPDQRHLTLVPAEGASLAGVVAAAAAAIAAGDRPAFQLALAADASPAPARPLDLGSR